MCPDLVLIKKPFDFRDNEDILRKEIFKQLGGHILKKSSVNDIENLYNKLREDWFYDVYQNQNNKPSFFNLLIHFNKQVLEENNKNPFVKNENLLRWRELTHLLGEDLFTCSYFAYMDNRSSRSRSFFAWRSVIFSNNNRLRHMLQQGLAENHFHLKGSGPVFELAWMATMNYPIKMMEKFRVLKKEDKLNSEIVSSFSNSKKDIEILVYKAALIRFELFKEMQLEISSGDNLKIDNLLNKESNKFDSFELILYLSELQKEIFSYSNIHAYSFAHKGRHDFADYYIPKNISEINFTGSVLLSGERKFLYDIFRKIYANTLESQRSI